MLIFFATISALSASATPAASTDRPPISIWMNNDRRFREGDRVRLQVDAEVDGFLLVLNYDTDGRLRVLFPLDPRDDALVHAGRRYEVRDEGSEAAFRAGADGTGLIYTAIAREPWRLDDIVLQDRWDYARITIDRQTDDPERAITDLVQTLAGPGGFDYDVAGYRVYGTATRYSYGDYGVRGPIYVYNDYLYCNDWYWRYDGCRRWPYDGGWSFGFNYGYYPYRYGYYPYNYGYYPYGHGYYPYTPYYPSGSGRSRPVLVGRPRSATVYPRPVVGSNRTGGSIGSTATGRSVTPPAINWRPRSVARPVSGRGAEAPNGSGEGRVAIPPPARRAREGGSGYFGPQARGGEGRSRGDEGHAQPRSYSPPPTRSSGGGGGGGGGGGHASGGGGGGGHSAPPAAPSRPRRP